METVNRSVVARSEGERRINGLTEQCQSTETILCDTVVVDTCHHSFVKSPWALGDDAPTRGSWIAADVPLWCGVLTVRPWLCEGLFIFHAVVHSALL